MIELIWLVSFSIRDVHGGAIAAAVPLAEVLDDMAKMNEFALISSVPKCNTRSLNEFYPLVITVPMQSSQSRDVQNSYIYIYIYMGMPSLAEYPINIFLL